MVVLMAAAVVVQTIATDERVQMCRRTLATRDAPELSNACRTADR